jgi:hypothetical protein
MSVISVFITIILPQKAKYPKTGKNKKNQPILAGFFVFVRDL